VLPLGKENCMREHRQRLFYVGAALLLLFVFAPLAVVFAQTPETPADAVGTVSAMMQAYESGAWPVFAGAVVTLLVYAANLIGLKRRVGPKAVPWVSLIIGVASTVGLGLSTGGDVVAVLIDGVMVGLASIGTWELIGKNVAPKAE
jgi:hypothetical protein